MKTLTKRRTLFHVISLFIILLTGCGPAGITTREPISIHEPTESVVTTTTTPTLLPPLPTAIAQPQAEEYFHLGWTWAGSKWPLMDDVTVDANGTIYAVDEGGTLYAIASPGKLLWKFKEENYDSATAPVVGPDGTIYFIGKKDNAGFQLQTTPYIEVENKNEKITDYQAIYALKPDGQIKWKVFPELSAQIPNASFDLSSSILMSPDGSFYIDAWSSDLDYTPIFHVQPNGNITIIKEAVGQRVFARVVDSQNRLIVWNLDNHEIYTITPDGKIVSNCKEKKYVRSLFVEKDGTFIYRRDFGDDAEVEIVARKPNCDIKWVYRTGNSVNSVDYDPIISDQHGIIYFSVNMGVFIALDAQDGNLLWKSDITEDSEDIKHLILGTNQVFFLGEYATVGAFSLSGERLWHHPLYDPAKPGFPIINNINELLLVHNGKILAFTADKSFVKEEPFPTAKPSSKEQAENEIADFMLNYLSDKITRSLDNNSSGTKVNEEIVVWASEDLSLFDEGEPIKVWLYKNGALIEASDPQKTLDEFRKANIDNYWYDYYAFSIKSVSDDFRNAKIYLYYDCGIDCGTGHGYDLLRSPSGEWWIYSSKWLWIS